MNSADWKEIAELIGIFAIVASLIFVGLQMRQEQEIAIVDAMSLRVETSAQLANLISQNRDVWTRATSGQELSKTDEAIVEAMLDIVENHYTNLFVRYARIGPFRPESAVRDFAYALYRYPKLAGIYRRDRVYDRSRDEAYGLPAGENEFRNQVDEELDRLVKQRSSELPERPFTFW